MHQATSSLSKKIVDLVCHGSSQEALSLYQQVFHSSGATSAHGFFPSFLPSLIKASSSQPRHLPFVFQLHCAALKTGLASDSVTANSLLSAYSKHSLVDSASQVFDTCSLRDAVTWHAMVNCYVVNERLAESMEMFCRMHAEGCAPKPELTAAVLAACGRAGNEGLGRAIHARFCVQSGEDLKNCVLLPTSLVDMYAKCYDLDSALKVFDIMPERNVVSWTAMITGCVTNGRCKMSVELFQQMVAQGIEPNRATLLSVLPACAELHALKHGKETHGYVLRHGLEFETKIIGALLDVYGRCKGAHTLAIRLHERAPSKDVVKWSSIMASSNRSGDYVSTLEFFNKMQKDGVKPNSVTLLVVIAACIGLLSPSHGEGVHGYVLRSGLVSQVFVGNSLIDMYAKLGCLVSSKQVFDEMPEKDSVSYSCMIASYGLQGLGREALNLFNEMLDRGVKPDGYSVLAVLSACNHAGLIDEAKHLFLTVGRQCHGLLGTEHYACFVDILGRSGKVDDVCEFIRRMPTKPSPKILGSLVMAYKAHGMFEAAQNLAIHLIELEPENAANYTLLSIICTEAGDWYGAETSRNLILERKLDKCFGRSHIQDDNTRIYAI